MCSVSVPTIRLIEVKLPPNAGKSLQMRILCEVDSPLRAAAELAHEIEAPKSILVRYRGRHVGCQNARKSKGYGLVRRDEMWNSE